MPMPGSCRAAAGEPAPLASSSFPAILPFAACRSVAWCPSRVRPVLIAGIAAILLVGGPAAHAEPVSQTPGTRSTIADPFAAFIVEAKQRFGIPAAWIGAVMQAESAGNARAVSSAGAMGLMQVMPETWAVLRDRYGLGPDPYDAHDNIMAGAAYLRELHDRYGAPGFLAAYNAGAARYENHLATGRPLPAETLAYLEALAPLIGSTSTDGTTSVAGTLRPWTDAPLFATHFASSTVAFAQSDPHSAQPAADRAIQEPATLVLRPEGLFVRLGGKSEQVR
jgi:Transglycosylase SLT domain